MAKKLTGTVVSNKMDKTLVVSVHSVIQHPIYKKVMKITKKYKVHADDAQTYTIGQTVTIQEIKPISRHKHFKVIEKVI